MTEFVSRALRHPALIPAILILCGLQAVLAFYFPTTSAGLFIRIAASAASVFAYTIIAGSDWSVAASAVDKEMQRFLKILPTAGKDLLDIAGKVTAVEFHTYFDAADRFQAGFQKQTLRGSDRAMLRIGEMGMALIRRGLVDAFSANGGDLAAHLRLTHAVAALHGAAEALNWPAEMAEKMRLRARDRLAAALAGRAESADTAIARITAVVSLLRSLPKTSDKQVYAAFQRIADASAGIAAAIQAQPAVLQSLWDYLDNDIPKIERIMPVYARLAAAPELTPAQRDEVAKIRSDILALPDRVGERIVRINQADIKATELASSSLAART